ncbi:hypothetical protein [Acanthopleuribacter pedis]|uniref:Uncharacterized protein n=1 Tax=Acanthopleuribacter pedis TaxID=442870 RepID=A0A8J7U316_9BACT|nr:hypothetical protein [Acanthopleuribacter pedis]MBO1319157.1 hypothetical protein [Acanthopleuribacter pedis]
MPFLRYVLVSCWMLMPLWGGEWVLPWLSNRDNEWASSVTFNNHGDSPAGLELTAVRANGDTFTANLDAVVAGGQVIRTVGELFPDLGSGGGFSLFAVSDSDAWTMSAKVSSLNTDSGDSPAIAEAVPLAKANTRIVFPSLPYAFGANTAIVLVNLGDSAEDVVLQVFTEQGLTWASNPIRLEPRRPSPQVMALVFPELTVASQITVFSSSAVVGSVFNFNTRNEPSLMNAQPYPVANTAELDSLLVTMNTSAEIMAAYGATTTSLFNKDAPAKREDCPAVDVSFNPGQTESFLTATLDWGSGCTNMLGAFHAGAIAMSWSRQGSLTAGWMAGQVAFDDFVTRYSADEYRIVGVVEAEGSTVSSNFMLNGAWRAAASGVFASGTVEAAINLTINRRDGLYQVQGAYQTRIAAAYNYDVAATIDASDPVVYDLSGCGWPTSGTVQFQVYSTPGFTGSLNFATGDCSTAVLTIGNQSETITLGTGS